MARAVRQTEDPLAFLRDETPFGDLAAEARFAKDFTDALDALHTGSSVNTRRTPRSER
ncbi:hypothetical protein [Glaciihabitans sp. UYNi722]|uniref:hypothetical protein n=1 Tax=Glaciihabitans sp. UYNi722 TaxID=3156344 RepID=UPI00339AED9A